MLIWFLSYTINIQIYNSKYQIVIHAGAILVEVDAIERSPSTWQIQTLIRPEIKTRWSPIWSPPDPLDEPQIYWVGFPFWSIVVWLVAVRFYVLLKRKSRFQLLAVKLRSSLRRVCVGALFIALFVAGLALIAPLCGWLLYEYLKNSGIGEFTCAATAVSFVASLIMSCLTNRALLRATRYASGTCESCGYLLCGLTGMRCPECGAANEVVMMTNGS